MDKRHVDATQRASRLHQRRSEPPHRTYGSQRHRLAPLLLMACAYRRPAMRKP